MTAPKDLNRWGLVGAAEGSYGTYATPANSAGILVMEPPEVTETPIHDGSRVGQAPGTGGEAARVAQSGFESAFDAVMEGIGGGAAYDVGGTVRPSVDLLMRILGWSATADTTASQEKITYAPESTGWESASFRSLLRGEENQIRGAYSESLAIEVDGPAVPSWTFAVRGIRNAAPSDVSLPSITGYPAATNLPPKAESVNLTVNGVTSLILRGFTFNYSAELTPRANENSTGHAGFSRGKRSITLVLRVEGIALATYNPYVLRDNGTLHAIGLDIGSVQYKRWKIDAPQAQLVTVDKEGDGPTALWTLTHELKPSTYTADDDCSIVFD